MLSVPHSKICGEALHYILIYRRKRHRIIPRHERTVCDLGRHKNGTTLFLTSTCAKKRHKHLHCALNITPSQRTTRYSPSTKDQQSFSETKKDTYRQKHCASAGKNKMTPAPDTQKHAATTVTIRRSVRCVTGQTTRCYALDRQHRAPTYSQARQSLSFST